MEKVICKICNRSLNQITWKHLDSCAKITFKEYQQRFPNEKTITDVSTLKRSQSFHHPCSGKTLTEAYGAERAAEISAAISKGQIGRSAPPNAGTGITGTRKDTGLFARSTYEANLDRIFALEGKHILGEFDAANHRQEMQDGTTNVTYQPDRVDVDGFFGFPGALIEVKGYMWPDDWKKICLFRQQNPLKKLLVIGCDPKTSDVNYNDLTKKYQSAIPLWETESSNYQTRPDLYRIDYVAPDREKMLKETYPNGTHIDIRHPHWIFISNRCLSYNKARGKTTYIRALRLIAITNRRAGASRLSSGPYNFELWRVDTEDCQTFWVTNQSKTVTFYCYEKSEYSRLYKFFNGNCDMSLTCGPKPIKEKVVPGFKVPKSRVNARMSYAEYLAVGKTDAELRESGVSKHLIDFYHRLPVITQKLPREQFVDLYERQGVQLEDVATLHGVARGDLTFLRLHYGIARLHPKKTLVSA